VKHLFIGSGVRYDMLLQETDDEELIRDHEEYARELIDYHVSGRLKVAPEHTSDAVLKLMRKPSFTLFHKFKEFFDDECKRIGKRQQIIPYFISSHPGCTEADMAELALETKQLGFQLEQVQDFTPTPMTIATEMFYSEMTPDGKPLYVAKTPEQKRSQRQFFFWYIPENRPQIRATLERLKLGKIGRLLLSRSAKAEGKEFFPSKEREENEDYRQRDQQKREQRAVTIVPQKSGEKGRWENSARKERRAAQFGDPRENRNNNREGRRDDNHRDFRDENRNSNFGNGEQRKSFHSDRKFNGDRRDSSGNKGRNFRDNQQNNRNNQRGNEKRNNSPVQFSSFRRGK
jgi:hypothetical protein